MYVLKALILCRTV